MPPSKSTLISVGTAEVIADVQKQPSPRTIDIDKVGVKNICERSTPAGPA